MPPLVNLYKLLAVVGGLFGDMRLYALHVRLARTMCTYAQHGHLSKESIEYGWPGLYRTIDTRMCNVISGVYINGPDPTAIGIKISKFIRPMSYALTLCVCLCVCVYVCVCMCVYICVCVCVLQSLWAQLYWWCLSFPRLLSSHNIQLSFEGSIPLRL